MLILAVLMVIRPVVPILEYAINYDYISKVLCENKQNPKSCCKGKCHLGKQLKNVFDDSANSNTPGQGKSSLPEEIISICFYKIPAFDFRVFQYESSARFSLKNQDLYDATFAEDFFHPPAFFI